MIWFERVQKVLEKLTPQGRGGGSGCKDRARNKEQKSQRAHIPFKFQEAAGTQRRWGVAPVTGVVEHSWRLGSNLPRGTGP